MLEILFGHRYVRHDASDVHIELCKVERCLQGEFEYIPR